MQLNIHPKFLRYAILTVFFILIHTDNTMAGNAILSWQSPTTNADGTPLTDLKGYKVYYGTSSGNYSINIDVGNVTIYQIDNLAEGLTYFFAVTAYDISGNESTFSNEVSKYISPPLIPEPDISISDSVSPPNDMKIPFGEVTEGVSTNQTITINNNGDANLVLGNIANSNAVSSPFSIVNDYCSGQTIAPSSACSLTIRFSPARAGVFSDSFDIPSNDPDENPIIFSINGTGKLIPTPDITVTDSVAPSNDRQIPFGSITEGTSSEKSITISNDGSSDLNIISIAQNNHIASPFGIIDDQCSGQSLSPSSSCTFSVRFSPSVTGIYNDSFDISSNDPDENPVTFSISGTAEAMPTPDITVSDSVAPTNDRQISFGSITEGTSSEKSITISNDGNSDLIIGNIASNNQVASPFSIINDQCSGQILSPASSCTLNVRFLPSAAVSFSDSFDIPSNDSDESSITFSISGTGKAIPVPDIDISDSIAPAGDHKIVFGELTQGMQKDATITISNNGNANLDIGYIAQGNRLAAPFSIINDRCSGLSLSPSSSCTIDVRFAPSAVTVYSDSFDIPSNDPDENPVIINLNGSGLTSITNNPPTVPTPVFPANQQTGLGSIVDFRWKKVSDPDGDPVMYELKVCEDSNLTIGCITESNIAFAYGNDITYAGLGISTKTHLLLNLLLLLPVSLIFLISRINSRRILSIVILIVIMGILLTACGGGGSGVGGGIVQTGPSSSAQNDELSHTISGLNPATTYFWKVTVTDGNGGTTNSEIMSFSTQ